MSLGGRLAVVWSHLFLCPPHPPLWLTPTSFCKHVYKELEAQKVSKRDLHPDHSLQQGAPGSDRQAVEAPLSPAWDVGRDQDSPGQSRWAIVHLCPWVGHQGRSPALLHDPRPRHPQTQGRASQEQCPPEGPCLAFGEAPSPPWVWGAAAAGPSCNQCTSRGRTTE